MKEKIDKAAIFEKTITRDQVKEWLTRDIKGVYVLLAEIINSDECQEALVEVFWQRYLRQQKEQEIKSAINGQEDVQ